MIFFYSAIVLQDKQIIELAGTHRSLNEDTALFELQACGIKVIELRKASIQDIEIERLKKLREKMSSPIVPIVQPPKTKKWWEVILKRIFK